MHSPVKEEILKLVDALPESQLVGLLNVMKQMQNSTNGKPGRFDRFCGIFTKEEADSVEQVIEKEFEQVENDV